MECSDHSRYHLLGAEMLKNVNGIVTQLDELAGARTDVATWSRGTLGGRGCHLPVLRRARVVLVHKMP